MKREALSSVNNDRVRVCGKFFARGSQRMRFQGVTYGPFALNSGGEPFPSEDQIRRDFEQMRQAGINSIRTYNVPTDWVLDIADEGKISVLVDVPWSKHLCFFDNHQAQKDARNSVKNAVKQGKRHLSIIAYSIGNEIPPDIIRWYGPRRVERFLRELMEVAKQQDPDVLVTYSNYPSTEYLDLSFFDFIIFNVYLHDVETFRRYLFRLQHIAGEKPLVLGEIGMDTIRHGETEQANFLAGHTKEAILMGAAGVFVFSWTDDWFTGGYQIEDWAFGITQADRSPKDSYHKLKDVFKRSPSAFLEETPRVSVVVCSYNGGNTLEQCLNSLKALDYPNYEVILVDDGSNDNTREIVQRFSGVRNIHQNNKGLSTARNVGLQASTGAVIAYTDSDCFVDSDWLTHLVFHLQRSDAVAVGGPNLTPEDGWLAACAGASPGQPTHVMENDQVAEHIPGCNMAFRREALESINGFDPEYRQAGDDVDVCWRLQQAGSWITYAPGGFVWHHRRRNPRAYLRQQIGYGKAEALLRLKHPEKYNLRGEGRWRGVLYGNFLQGLRLGRSAIYRGTFGTGPFQTIYQPNPAYWALLPSTLEWHGMALLVALATLFWPPAWVIALGMIGLSMAVAGLQAAQAQLPFKYDGLKSHLIIAFLCYAQPLIRSWKRYLSRFLSFRTKPVRSVFSTVGSAGLPLRGTKTAVYWTEEGRDRTELLNQVVVSLTEKRWKKKVDSGWSKWDIEVYCQPWTGVQASTVQEDYGNGKRSIRVRYRLRFTRLAIAMGVIGFIATAVVGGFNLRYAAGIAGGLIAGLMWTWWRGTHLASRVVELFDSNAGKLCLIRTDSSSGDKR